LLKSDWGGKTVENRMGGTTKLTQPIQQTMKSTLTAITLAATCALVSSALGGSPTITSNKEYKAAEQEQLCFSDHEFQLDIFGQYSVGEGPDRAATFRDHGWGGGLGLNYFFTRNLGIGIDGAWLYAKEPSYSGSGNGSHKTTIHNFSGSLIYRMPIDHLCLAPYIYAGGGYSVDGEDWATAHAGVGVEYRITPQKLGVFLDGRWTYFGDRFNRDDLNNFSTRLGFRVIF